MAWLDTTVSYLPTWLQAYLARLLGLRASPRLLLIICTLQFVVLACGILTQIHRTECAVVVPQAGNVVIECDSCIQTTLSIRGLILNACGAAVIACGALAVLWRNQQMLYVYGTCMLFFSVVIGMTAMLTVRVAAPRGPARPALSHFPRRRPPLLPALPSTPRPSLRTECLFRFRLSFRPQAFEVPVLEVAVEGVSGLEPECLQFAAHMLEGARSHATLNSLGCLVDTIGAILAIRSRVSAP